MMKDAVPHREPESTSGPSEERALALLRGGPILLYDGECGVCNRSVQWILEHERRKALRFAALKSEIGQMLLQRARVPSEVDSLVWVESQRDRILGRVWSSAVLATVKYVGGPWRLFSLARIIPRPLRDALYRSFARHRLRLAAPVCLVPAPAARGRFLDS